MSDMNRYLDPCLRYIGLVEISENAAPKRVFLLGVFTPDFVHGRKQHVIDVPSLSPECFVY